MQRKVKAPAVPRNALPLRTRLLLGSALVQLVMMALLMMLTESPTARLAELPIGIAAPRSGREGFTSASPLSTS